MFTQDISTFYKGRNSLLFIDTYDKQSNTFMPYINYYHVQNEKHLPIHKYILYTHTHLYISYMYVCIINK